MPSTLDVGPDPRVLAVTGLLALVVGLLFSAVPAWRASHRDPALLLQEGPNVTAATGRTGAVLVGTQIALSIVLLINAGLLVRTLELLAHVDPGLQTDGVLILEPRSRPGAHEGLDYESYHRQLIEELRSVRGVRAASISQGTPLMGADWSQSVTSAAAPTQEVTVAFNSVSPGFFDTLGIPFAQGRDFRWTDGLQSRRVAILSQSLARRLFPTGSAVGDRINIGGLPTECERNLVGN